MLTYSDICDDTNDYEWLDFMKQAYPYMDFSLTELIFSANDSTTWRGHSVVWNTIDYIKGYAYGECSCGAGVTCRTHPSPNQIDIGGSAVAVNCKRIKA